MKREIRKKILAKREALSHKEILEKSQMIFQKLKKMPLYNHAENVMIYMDFRNEVKTDQIIHDLRESGKKVMIPLTVPKTKEMIPSELLNPEIELEKTKFGVLEPKKQYIRERNPNILDLIIVPCVAFSLQGYRIGYGAGYYDRFFSSLENPIPSVGLAFDLQIIDSFPSEPHDLKVDFILTETQMISCK